MGGGFQVFLVMQDGQETRTRRREDFCVYSNPSLANINDSYGSSERDAPMYGKEPDDDSERGSEGSNNNGIVDILHALRRLESKVDGNSSRIKEMEQEAGSTVPTSRVITTNNQHFPQNGDASSIESSDEGYGTMFHTVSPTRRTYPRSDKVGPCKACYQTTIMMKNANDHVADLEESLTEVEKAAKER